MSGRLTGKRVLLTAAGQGIGRATALLCAAEGARVVATDRDEGLLTALQADAGSAEIEVAPLDVTDGAACAALADRVGAVDGLVSVAGFVHPGSILECSEEDWDFAFELNVKGMHRVVRAFLPAMVAAAAKASETPAGEGRDGQGSVVLMSSVAGAITGVPNRYAYSATKAAVLGMARSIAADFVGKGIRCNAVCPGTVQSPSLNERIETQAAAQGATADDVRDGFVARQPMGRLGRPEEIAALVVYLLSDDAGYTTGQGHVIDGGWCI